MKRYEPHWDNTIVEFDPIESPDGQWVKYEDVKKLEFAYSNLLKEFGELSKMLAGCIPDVSDKGHLKDFHGEYKPECNCEEKFNDIKKRPLLSEVFNVIWFCPAHGYKKL